MLVMQHNVICYMTTICCIKFSYFIFEKAKISVNEDVKK